MFFSIFLEENRCTPIFIGVWPGKTKTLRIAFGSPDIPPECGYPLSSAQYEDPTSQLSD
jgi:hypothetical protein